MEMMMQYVWQHRLWPHSGLSTVDGRPLRVIDPGQLNTGAGPDFFNAKVEIDGEAWAGNVEIHDRASDWRRHGHDKDPAYESVILHVVNRDDTMVRRPSGSVIPQVLMPNALTIRDRYLRMKGAPPAELPCASTIARMERVHISDWITALGFERLYEKSDRLIDTVNRLNGDWEETAYRAIARAMGMGANNDTFERLAASVPMKVLRHHNDSIESVEALLFGQADLLDPEATPDDEYPRRLATDYRFLAHKYSLHPIERSAWKLGGMRHWNFPYRRIATLAALIQRNYGLMGIIRGIDTLEQASEMFQFPLEGYWATRHRFGPAAAMISDNAISASSTRILIINAVIPLIHAYATAHGDESRALLAVDMLQEMKAESNSIVSAFVNAGLPCRDAFTSQALIQLRRAYCEPRKCMYCRIGHRHLTGA